MNQPTERRIYRVDFVRPVAVAIVDEKTGRRIGSRLARWLTGFTSKYAAKSAIKQYGVDGSVSRQN